MAFIFTSHERKRRHIEMSKYPLPQCLSLWRPIAEYDAMPLAERPLCVFGFTVPGYDRVFLSNHLYPEESARRLGWHFHVLPPFPEGGK